MKPTENLLSSKLSRRKALVYGAATALSTPFVSRAWAAPTVINMLAGMVTASRTSLPSSRPRTTSSSSRNTMPAATACWG